MGAERMRGVEVQGKRDLSILGGERRGEFGCVYVCMEESIVWDGEVGDFLGGLEHCLRIG